MSRVLVADNDPIDLLTIKTRLSQTKLNTDVTTATSFKDALALLNSMVFDIIIMDEDLGGGRGHRLVQLIRANPSMRRVPVVMVTGSSSAAAPSVLEKMFQRGQIQGWIPKDVLSADVLLNTLTGLSDEDAASGDLTTRTRELIAACRRLPHPPEPPRSRPRPLTQQRVESIVRRLEGLGYGETLSSGTNSSR